jgi:hypothetical protein
VKILGFPPWAHNPEMRADLLAQRGIDEDIFDGWEANLHDLMRVIGKEPEGTGHWERMKGSLRVMPYPPRLVSRWPPMQGGRWGCAGGERGKIRVRRVREGCAVRVRAKKGGCAGCARVRG